jgi:hypothetical protein
MQRWLACGFLVALFVWSIAFFYLPGQGFTYMIQFGALEHHRYLPEVKAVNHYEAARSPGYDSQWYVQIAMHPHLHDAVLRQAVDSLPYRARRILFEWTAWVLGGGNPWLVMNIFALQNVACWFLLAVLLFRWFPPTSWDNFARWGAVLYSFGLIFSVRGALLDGPSLLVTTIGMALIESGRLWWGALTMGISGLGKDTSILCGAALPPADPRNAKTWAPWLGRGVLLVLPLAAWMIYLRYYIGHGDPLGRHNFDGPFVGLVNKFQEVISNLISEGYPFPTVAKYDLFVLVGLLTQFLFFASRIRWHNPWWRIGASYAALMVFLGDAVWENYPSAAGRVLLPMTLAFNVLVPRGRRGCVVLLILGNLGVLASADLLKPPGRESFVALGPRELRINPKDGIGVQAVYGPRNWWDAERSRWEYWRWSMGDCTITLRNPQPFPVVADVSFRLRSADTRAAIVKQEGKVIWHAGLQPDDTAHALLADMVLPPGDTVLTFESDRPPAYPDNYDRRRLTFSIRGLEIDVKGRR